MKKITILSILLILTLGSVGCAEIGKQITSNSYPSFSDSPYDNVYEIQTYSGNISVLLTTQTLPTIEGKYLKVENYWWREWDEEGNEEWLRYLNDYYYVLYPIEQAVIILHIPDKNNTAHIVIFGEP